LVFVVVVVFMRTRLQKKRVVAAFTFLLVKKAGRLLVAESSFTSSQSLASFPTQRRKKSLGTGIIWRGIFKKYGKEKHV
jgi:5-deoxy-D-glucuronate isomerase